MSPTRSRFSTFDPADEGGRAGEAWTFVFQTSIYERDQRFRSALSSITHIGMQWAGVVGLIGLALHVVLHAGVLGQALTWTYVGSSAESGLALPTLLAIAAGSAALIGVGAAGCSLGAGRMMMAGVVWAGGVVVTYDGVFGAGHGTEYLALIYLIGVSAVPFRPWQVLLLGLALMAAVGATVLVPPELLPAQPAEPIRSLVYTNLSFLAVMTGLATGVSVILYRRHWSRIRVQAQLERSQRVFRQTETIARVGGWTLDVRSGQIWWTPEVYDIVGVDYDFDLSFRSVLRFYEPSARSTLMSAVRDCLRHGESYDVEIPIVTAGGEQRWLRVRGEAEREEGEVTWMFGAVQDVTERKLRERRLQEAKEAAERAQQQAEASREEAERQRRRAEAASRSKSRFLAGVAHDLKTPLTSIDGFADVLVDRLSGEDEHHARLIRESAATIGEMADSLMELSRLEAGGLNVDTRPIDVRPVLEAVVDLFRERAEKRGVDLQLSLPQNPVVADVDDDLLARAVTNLVENAVKYVRSGDRVDVWVSAAASDRDDLAPKATASGIIGDRQINGTPAGTVETDEAVVIGVDDDGPGMEPEFVDKMFEPFSRNRLDTEGTGLGLAVTRELVEAIGGEIEGDSELGRGTWFRIRLPVAGVEDGPAPHTPASDPGSDAPDADK